MPLSLLRFLWLVKLNSTEVDQLMNETALQENCRWMNPKPEICRILEEEGKEQDWLSLLKCDELQWGFWPWVAPVLPKECWDGKCPPLFNSSMIFFFSANSLHFIVPKIGGNFFWTASDFPKLWLFSLVPSFLSYVCACHLIVNCLGNGRNSVKLPSSSCYENKDARRVGRH